MSAFLRQTPAAGEVYLDHVGWFVADMAEASVSFERIGFTLTPFAAHRRHDPASGSSQPTGTGNRCAMLERGYVEILAAIEGAGKPLAREDRTAPDRAAGVHVIAFAVPDAAAMHAHLHDHGFEPFEPVHLRRPLPVPGGEQVELCFTVVRVPPDRMREGTIQVLEHESPERVWQPELINRGNGIAALAGVLFRVDDPVEAAGRYGRFLGRQATGGREYAALQLDRGRLGFATPAGCSALLPGLPIGEAAGIAGVALLSPDVAVPRWLCMHQRVPLLFDEDTRFCIHPGSVMGTPMLVHGPSDLWPPETL